ncbi:MAG TPA: Gx transporter family protein [Clostridiaceae bacterium]|nr:Gx transporter family protein [Clostridiaceae bacterium]
MKKVNVKKMVLLAVLISQALVLSIIESWIPLPMPVPVPGIKLGLANIVSIIVIVYFGYREALAVVLIRCLLTSFFSGGITVFLFSIAGGILSTIVMSFLYKKFSNVFSIIGISISGAVMHNMGQIVMAVIVMKDIAVLGYLPVLVIAGIVTGLLVGIAANLLIKGLEKSKMTL